MQWNEKPLQFHWAHDLTVLRPKPYWLYQELNRVKRAKLQILILVLRVRSYWVVPTFRVQETQVEQLRINSAFVEKLRFFWTAEEWAGPCSSLMFFMFEQISSCPSLECVGCNSIVCIQIWAVCFCVYTPWWMAACWLCAVTKAKQSHAQLSYTNTAFHWPCSPCTQTTDQH